MHVRKTLILFAVAGLCRFAAGESTAATNAVVVTPAFLSTLVEELRTNHPALLAGRARTNAAGAGIAAVRTWEDPLIRLGGMAASEMMRADEGDILYGVEQQLPLWGRPALARRVAQAELAVETANLEFQFQKLKSELARSAFRAALAGQVVTIGEQDLVWLQTMADATDAKLQTGQATLVESLWVRNEWARRETQLQSERNNLAQARVRLNRLLNRELQSFWPSLDLPPVAGPVHFNEQLVGFALKYEPRLRMMREQIRQANARVEATRKARLPEVAAGVQSRNYSGNGEWRQTEFMLNFSLPVFNKHKYRADLQREEAKLRTAEWEAADYELALREEVHGLTVKTDAARREALLYRDEIEPRTAAAFESAQALWASGRGTFRDVLEAHRMLLESRLMYARAVSEQYQMLSELVLCCGLGDLEALQMIGALPETPVRGTTP